MSFCFVCMDFIIYCIVYTAVTYMIIKWSQNLCDDYRDIDDIEGRKHTGMSVMSEGMSGHTIRHETKEYLFFDKYVHNNRMEEEHKGLDEIDNLMIHNDDRLVEDIDNMEVTGSNHFVDLDMKISDAR